MKLVFEEGRATLIFTTSTLSLFGSTLISNYVMALQYRRACYTSTISWSFAIFVCKLGGRISWRASLFLYTEKSFMYLGISIQSGKTLRMCMCVKRIRISGWHSIVSRTGFFTSIDFLFKSKEDWRISISDCYGGTIEAVKCFIWSSFSNMKFACRHHFCGLNFADCCCILPCNKHEFLFFSEKPPR